MVAKAGRLARIKVSGDPVALTDEPTTGISDTEYQITDAAKRVLPPEAAITVEVSTDAGATFVAAGKHSLNRFTGTVLFDAAQAAGTLVQVSGTYLPVAQAASCKSYSVAFAGQAVDVSDFDSEWVSRIVVGQDVTGSLGKWTTDSRYFEDAIIAAETVLIELWTDRNAAAPDFMVWAILASDELSGAVDGAQETSIEWEGTTDLDGNVLHEL